LDDILELADCFPREQRIEDVFADFRQFWIGEAEGASFVTESRVELGIFCKLRADRVDQGVGPGITEV